MQQRELYDADHHGGDDGEDTGGRHTVPPEEVVLAQTFQLEALMNVLERQGMIKKAELLAEIKALQTKTPKGA